MHTEMAHTISKEWELAAEINEDFNEKLIVQFSGVFGQPLKRLLNFENDLEGSPRESVRLDEQDEKDQKCIN